MTGPGTARVTGLVTGRVAGALAALLVYAFALLSIGIDRDWRLRHEDNGAIYTTIALSHLHLGPAETRGHDFLVSRDDGRKEAYGHHPPGLGLALAAAFRLIGSADPWAARAVPIAFQLGSIILLVFFLRRFTGPRTALLGGFFMATMPMGAFFGRNVCYEPPTLFFTLLALHGWAAYRAAGRAASLALLAAGVALGGLTDWPAFFIALALCALEGRAWLRGRRAAGARHSPAAFLTLAAAGAATFAFNLWHLAWANGGSLAPLAEALFQNPRLPGQGELSPVKFALTQLEIFRRYYTHTGLICTAIAVAALFRPSLNFFGNDLLRAAAGVLLAGGAAYVCAIAGYATSHHYSTFYLLPAVAAAMALGFRRLLPRRPGERAPGRRRLLLALVCVEVAVTASYTLYRRHTKPEPYAINTVAYIRAGYLRPEDVFR